MVSDTIWWLPRVNPRYKPFMSPERVPSGELALYRSIFDLSMLGTAHVTADGRLDWCNPAFAVTLGYEVGELIGVCIFDLLHPEDAAVSRKHIAGQFDGEIPRVAVERRYRHKKGHYLWVNITSRPVLDEHGKTTHIVGVLQDISERKKQEEELRESRERLDSILGTIQDVVWSFSARDYRLEFLNEPAASRTYGRTAAEFFADPDLWQRVVHADDRDLVASIWGRLASSGSAEDHYRIVRPDGEVRWVHARAWTTIDSEGRPLRFEGVVRDVTESRHAELALRESEARLRLVVESGRLGIWELDTGTGKTTWSPGFKALLGLPENFQPTEGAFYERVHPDDVERIRQNRNELIEGRGDFPPFRIVRPDGTVRWLQNVGRAVRLLDGDCRSMRFMGAVLDVTETREAERIIEVQRAKIAASSKMSALGEMAGGVAHEINNPVAIIHGNAILLQQLAARGEVAPELMQQTARVIAQTAERISKITRSLLAFARDADQDPFQRISVRALVDETAEFCRERFRGHGIDFRIDPIDASLALECRPVQISQVVLNLLNNAHDAVEKLPERWIRIGVADLGERIELRVTDSGPGIPRGLEEKIFQPFFTTKDVGKGTGLGLSVASGIVESHAGTLRVDPASENTAFVLGLPKRQGK